MWGLFALALFATVAAAANAAALAPDTLRICVPHAAQEACLKMVEQGKTVGVEMACVPARDRIDCMNKMKQHEADFEPADPEDMYIALKRFGDAFNVFKEIRTKQEPDAEFRYEAVVVIHKDLAIDGVSGLKGLKSCHTGVGRNVGYKVPITKLTKMGLLPPLKDTKLSPRENELKALSSYFSKSCIVGQWSPDPDINRRLKQEYSNLCQLCEHPEKCNYPDKNSGYEGALRCLAVGGGEVAFTKVIFVKKFFGMAYGSHPATASEHKAADYAYLCPDGSRRAVGETPCTWAARPWQGYMAADDKHTQALREAIAKLNDLGEATHADWISSVLALNNETLAKDNSGPFKPSQYLEKAKYVDVLEIDVLKPRRDVRLCAASAAEARKCEDLASFAYSRAVRPSIVCVNKSGPEECFEAARQRQVDLVSADPGLAVNAVGKFDLEPVLHEEYDDELKTTAVAVVKKKSSAAQSWADLRGKRACMARPGQAAGWIIPVHNLVENSLIEKNNCPYTKALTEFFAGVDYSEDPFKCLTSGKGDVAFLDHYSVTRNVDGGEFAGDVKSADFELLCKNGGRKPLDQFSTCNQGSVPPRVLLSSKSVSAVERDDVLFALLGAAEVYGRNPNYFKMFGSYNGQPDVLFSDAATGFETVHQKDPLSEFSKLHDDLKTCTPQESKP